MLDPAKDNACVDCHVLFPECQNCVENKCTRCEPNHLLNSETGKCEECGVAFENCEECTRHRCTKCSNSLNPDASGKCTRKCSEIRHCVKKCDGSGCTQCGIGFYGPDCGKCSSLCVAHLGCTHDGVCKQCMDGYFTKGTACLPCRVNHCQDDCDPKGQGRCKACLPNFGFVEEGGRNECVPCAVGQYGPGGRVKKGGAGGLKCSRCDGDHHGGGGGEYGGGFGPGCAECDADGCVKCKPGFKFVSREAADKATLEVRGECQPCGHLEYSEGGKNEKCLPVSFFDLGEGCVNGLFCMFSFDPFANNNVIRSVVQVFKRLYRM